MKKKTKREAKRIKRATEAQARLSSSERRRVSVARLSAAEAIARSSDLYSTLEAARADSLAQLEQSLTHSSILAEGSCVSIMPLYA